MWIETSSGKNNNNEIQTLVFDQLQYKFTTYDQNGIFLKNSTLGEALTPNLKIVDIIPATGLQIKYVDNDIDFRGII